MHVVAAPTVDISEWTPTAEMPVQVLCPSSPFDVKLLCPPCVCGHLRLEVRQASDAGSEQLLCEVAGNTWPLAGLLSEYAGKKTGFGGYLRTVGPCSTLNLLAALEPLRAVLIKDVQVASDVEAGVAKTILQALAPST